MPDSARRPRLQRLLTGFFEEEMNRPDLGRGLRCMVSFMAPLALSVSGRLPEVNMIFAAIAAQNLANVDIRGAYALRLVLLLAMTTVIAASSALGALATQPLALCLAATLAIALGAGLWRHLSSDYGPSLSTASGLLCFIAMAEPGGIHAASHHAIAALIGGLWGTLLHVFLWPIRPQHPLRMAVADTWIAAAGVCTANPDPAAESTLRTALDKAYAVLSAAEAKRPIAARLEELNRVAARLGQRVSAFQSAYDAMKDDPRRSEFAPAADALLTVLGNLCRTVALAVVSRQPSHLAAVDVRLRRARNLARPLQQRLEHASPEWRPVALTLAGIEAYLPEAGAALQATMERAGDVGAFSMELHDLAATPLRPLAAALNLSWRVDVTLVRFTARIAVLTLVGVWAMKAFHLPHGYWLPFTMLVVLQPDYGSTRIKAAQRLAGTAVGSVLGSVLLWLKLPFGALMAATALTAFIFGYYLRRNYGVAVVFITLFVVVLTESLGPATLALTGERVADTVVGGALALLAALIFWPVWERERVRRIFAHALRANAHYLRVAGDRLARGEYGEAAIAPAKRAAESAVAAAFSSLRRMSGDPKGYRDRMHELAAIANGNQRVTRIANVLALQQGGDALEEAGGTPPLRARAQFAANALDDIADALMGGRPADEALADATRELRAAEAGASSATPSGAASFAQGQLSRAAAEIEGLVLGARELAKPLPSAS